MSKLRIYMLVTGLTCFMSFTAYGQDGVSVEGGTTGGVGDGFLAGLSIFFFQDESSLGSNTLNEGSSTFTRLDLQYNFAEYFSGLGLFYESNSFGEDQVDTTTGLILEFFAGNFFFNYLSGFQVEQKFENRSFSTRKGVSQALELGLRAPLLFGISYYEFKLHQRTVTIIKEDGRDMDSKYVLSQTMPMLAIGMNL